MKYRVLGRTKLKVSEIGLGGHEYRRWLPGQRDMERFNLTQHERNKLIKRAVDAGINYFDTTHAEEAESLGLALKALNRRDDLHMAIMIFHLFRRMSEKPPSEWRQIIIDDIEEKLKLVNTDYADILTILDPENYYSPERLTAALEVFKELKKEGRIGFLGASSHQLSFLAEVMRRYDCFDTVMVRYNYHLQEARDVLFPLAKVLDVGVVIMKPFAWPYYGIPFARFGPVEGEQGASTPAQTCLRWILRSPEVATVVPGMNDIAELEENLGAVTIEEGEIDEKILARYLQVAQSEGKSRLKAMLDDPCLDISHYAKRALTQLGE